MGGRNKRSRDDIFALMQVMYTGQDAAPLQTCKWFTFVMAISTCIIALGILTERRCTLLHSMSAEDIWQRKVDELWLKLEKNTQDSFCTALWKWLEMVNSEAD